MVGLIYLIHFIPYRILLVLWPKYARCGHKLIINSNGYIKWLVVGSKEGKKRPFLGTGVTYSPEIIVVIRWSNAIEVSKVEHKKQVGSSPNRNE